jgi:PST family polysaccharide transporter
MGRVWIFSGMRLPADHLRGVSSHLRANFDLRRGRGRVLLGTVMLSAANASRLALQFILVPILARLLGPGVYGLMSVAMSFVMLANMLSDGGLGAALVLEQDPGKALESTVFWLTILIGSGLALLLCAVSWPISVLYSQPALLPVLCALAPILVLSPSLSVANAQIVRSQRFDLFAIGDFGCAVISAAVGIVLAYRGWGVWSLVAQQLLLWSSKVAWVSYVAGFWPRLVLRLRLVQPLLRFSAGNLATGVVDFAVKSAPVLIVGGMLGVQAAGHYAMAYQLTRVADMVVLNPVSVATFSSVAIAANRNGAATFVAAAWRILVLALAPVFLAFAFTADPLAPLLLGHRWIATAPVLSALSPGAFLICLYGFVTSALLGKGQAGGALKLTLIAGIAICLGTITGVSHGVVWAAAGFSLGTFSLAPLYVRALARSMHLSMMSLLSAATTSVMASAAMACIMLAMNTEAASASPFARLLLVSVSGLAVFAAVAGMLKGRQIVADIRTLRLHQPENSEPQPEAWPYMPPPVAVENPQISP